MQWNMVGKLFLSGKNSDVDEKGGKA